MNQASTARQESETSRLLKNSSWLLASQCVRAVELVLRSIFIARALGIENYAHYALIVAFVGPIQELCNANIGSAIIRYGTIFEARNQQHKSLALYKAAYSLTFLLYLLHLAIAAGAIYLLHDVFFQGPALHGLVMVFAAASGLTLFDATVKPMLRLHDRFRLYAIVEIMIAIVTCGAVYLACQKLKGDFSGIVMLVSVVLFLGSVSTNLASLWSLSSDLKGMMRVKLSELKGDWGELARFTFGNSLSTTIETATRRCDVLLLGALAPGVPVAHYDVSRRIANAMLLLRNPISMAAFPQISRLLLARKMKDLLAMLGRTYRILAAPALTILAAIYLFGDRIAALWGDEFLGAGGTLFLLCFRSTVLLVFFWTTSLLLSLGQIRFLLSISAITTTIGLAIAIPLAYRYSDMGMAFAMLLAAVLCQITFAVRGIRSGQSLTVANRRPTAMATD